MGVAGKKGRPYCEDICSSSVQFHRKAMRINSNVLCHLCAVSAGFQSSTQAGDQTLNKIFAGKKMNELNFGNSQSVNCKRLIFLTFSHTRHVNSNLRHLELEKGSRSLKCRSIKNYI